MARHIPVAWLQLSRDKPRLLVGLAGVAFAVILVFMQLGFQSSIYESATRYHRNLDYDLVLVSPKRPYIGSAEGFSRRRLYQALGVEMVASVSPLYLQQGYWKNPWRRNVRSILVVGIDPSRRTFLLTDVVRNREAIQREDAVLFDARSRPEYGPIAERFADEGFVSADVNDRKISVAGLFELGTSFGIDGSLVTSEVNFRRIFPDRGPGRIDLGLIQLVSGANPHEARERLDAALENDVLVLTREDFIGREVEYWASSTPIGYVFGFGAIMGVIVGAVIVYQILFADVSEHLREYATLKAMGYSNRFLSNVVLKEAVILGGLGYVPGVLVTVGLYQVTAAATRLPLELTLLRSVAVLMLALGMCAGAALIALRKVRSADPAEVFA